MFLQQGSIAIHAVADGLDPTRATVRDTMSPGIIFCYEDEDISLAAQMMQLEQIRRLPVLDRAKHLVGIVVLADIATGPLDAGISDSTLEGISEFTG